MRWREDLEVIIASRFKESRSRADESFVHFVSVVATGDGQVRVRSACVQSALAISTLNSQSQGVGSDLARELLSSSKGFVVHCNEGHACDSQLACPKAEVLRPKPPVFVPNTDIVHIT